MQLTDSDLREFADLWSQEFGETITDEQARLSAGILLELYFLLASVGSEEGL